MADYKVMAKQRAMELLEKMKQWEGVSPEKILSTVNNNNPYLPEFNVCMAVINSS